MVKTANSNSSSAISTDQVQKQRKKQAKREAKAMLAVESAKVDAEKAERKLTKAQARLEARTERLHTLEASLAEIRSSQEGTEVSAPDTGIDHQQGQPELAEETASSNQPEAPDPQSKRLKQKVAKSRPQNQPDIPAQTDQETSTPSAEEQTAISSTASETETSASSAGEENQG